MPTPHKRTTTQRGLGADHQRRRKALMPAAFGTHCPIAGPKCDGTMRNPRRMQLDHSTPRALGGKVGDRIVCMPCNTSEGAKLGAELARRRKANPSRDW